MNCTPAEAQAQRLRNRLHQLGLAEAWQALQQEMSPREHADEHAVDQQFLAEEHILECALKFPKFWGDRCDIGFRGEALAHERGGFERLICRIA